MTVEEIFTFENLYDAYKHCRLGKQHKGEVIRFETNLAVQLNDLRKDLKSKTYQLGNYKTFHIYEPKERLIEALPFKDRVVIRCFCDVCLKPKIEPKLIYDNCACRRGKGDSICDSEVTSISTECVFRGKNQSILFFKV